MVKDAIKRTRGAAGPSRRDPDSWCCMLISGNFGNVGEELQKPIAEITKREKANRVLVQVQVRFVSHAKVNASLLLFVVTLSIFCSLS